MSYLKVPSRLEAFCEELNKRRMAIDKTDIAAIYELSFWAHFELVSAFGLFRYGHCKLFGSQQWLNIMLHRIKNGFHAQKCRNLLPCFRLMTKTPTDLRLARYLPLLSPLPLYYKALPRTRFCGFQISVPVSHIPSSHYAW